MAAGSTFPLTIRSAFGGPDRNMVYLSSRRLPDGGDAGTLLDGDGRILAEFPLAGRGHGGAVSPDGRFCVLFARRPGTNALVIDRVQGSLAQIIRARPDRHFYGHGFFGADGRLLFATENDFDGARGVLGIYDATDSYRRVGEFDTGGIGPHQCLSTADGRMAVIANGGIETHPDFPRRKLNLATMAPNVTRIDLRTGACLDRQALPDALRQLSLRHIAEAPDGAIWIGGQYQGPEQDTVPLLAVARPGDGTLTPLDTLGEDGARARHYIGSVASNPRTGQIAVTAPRGGFAHILDGRTGQSLRRLEIPDVCGVAPLAAGFLFSDGQGGLWRDGETLSRLPGTAWDNHLTVLTAV